MVNLKNSSLWPRKNMMMYSTWDHLCPSSGCQDRSPFRRLHPCIMSFLHLTPCFVCNVRPDLQSDFNTAKQQVTRNEMPAKSNKYTPNPRKTDWIKGWGAKFQRIWCIEDALKLACPALASLASLASSTFSTCSSQASSPCLEEELPRATSRMHPIGQLFCEKMPLTNHPKNKQRETFHFKTYKMPLSSQSWNATCESWDVFARHALP